MKLFRTACVIQGLPITFGVFQEIKQAISNINTPSTQTLTYESFAPTLHDTKVSNANKVNTNDSPIALRTFSPTLHSTSEKPDSYFNYDPDSRWGPKHWEDVDVDDSDYFKFTKKRKNHCDKNHQSPVDIKKEEKCADDHVIHMNRGKLNFETIKFQIRPSSLRANLKQSKLSQSAFSDTSNLALSSKALYVDVKVPAEHTSDGKRYAAELHITHHWDRKEGRFYVLAVWLDDEDDVPNAALEMFIREWEEEAAKQKWRCSASKTFEVMPYNRTYERPNPEEMVKIWGDHCEKRYCPKGKADWDVYRFVPTMWYCGYKGSLTEPPCTETTHWRIFDLPLKISKDQTKRMTDLLVSQLDENCNKGSVAFNRTVARPIQRNGKGIYCCDSGDFKAQVQNEDYWKSFWPEDYHGRKGLK